MKLVDYLNTIISNQIYNIIPRISMKNITITTVIYFICLYETVFGTEYTRSAVTEQGGSIFAVAPSGNAFYIGGRNDQRIYRYEMLQELQSPTS